MLVFPDAYPYEECRAALLGNKDTNIYIWRERERERASERERERERERNRI